MKEFLNKPEFDSVVTCRGICSGQGELSGKLLPTVGCDRGAHVNTFTLATGISLPEYDFNLVVSAGAKWS
jgi:hypothetical protein